MRTGLKIGLKERNFCIRAKNNCSVLLHFLGRLFQNCLLTLASRRFDPDPRREAKSARISHPPHKLVQLGITSRALLAAALPAAQRLFRGFDAWGCFAFFPASWAFIRPALGNSTMETGSLETAPSSGESNELLYGNLGLGIGRRLHLAASRPSLVTANDVGKAIQNSDSGRIWARSGSAAPEQSAGLMQRTAVAESSAALSKLPAAQRIFLLLPFQIGTSRLGYPRDFG